LGYTCNHTTEIWATTDSADSCPLATPQTGKNGSFSGTVRLYRLLIDIMVSKIGYRRGRTMAKPVKVLKSSGLKGASNLAHQSQSVLRAALQTYHPKPSGNSGAGAKTVGKSSAKKRT
jgi:hypothetical protein